MKNYTQVYVKNSFEAAEVYCKAFGAEITREFKNEAGTVYEHCELSVNGEGFLALAEAKNPCDRSMMRHGWLLITILLRNMKPVCPLWRLLIWERLAEGRHIGISHITMR